jgi:hypothetical protein
MSVISAPVDWVELVSDLRLPPKADHRLQVLMDRNTEGQLSVEEAADLEALVELSETLSLVRAEALHLLGRNPRRHPPGPKSSDRSPRVPSRDASIVARTKRCRALLSISNTSHPVRWVASRDLKTSPGHALGVISASQTVLRDGIRKPDKLCVFSIRGKTTGMTIFVGRAIPSFR